MDKLESIKKEVFDAVKKAPNEGALADLERAYLGRSGKLIAFFKGLKNVPDSERKILGQKANEFKRDLIKEISSRRSEFGKEAKVMPARGQFLDITAPGKKFDVGHLHVLSKVIREVGDIFESMGFEIVFGPDVETEHYNFDALNVPKNHPARDMWDTFWLQNGLLLRTHTSPMQVRYMESHKPPFRIVVPGRCYRYEATDSTHDTQFYQLEGLMIGKSINLAHLKGIIEMLLKRLFSAKGGSASGGKGIEIRFRPSYFPFTEPSVEVDFRIGKDKKWLEIAGAGMVHPQVLKNVKIDPGQWQGFAFGIGLDRIAMLKYKINDIRLLYSGDLRFIKQF